MPTRSCTVVGCRNWWSNRKTYQTEEDPGFAYFRYPVWSKAAAVASTGRHRPTGYSIEAKSHVAKVRHGPPQIHGWIKWTAAMIKLLMREPRTRTQNVPRPNFEGQHGPWIRYGQGQGQSVLTYVLTVSDPLILISLSNTTVYPNFLSLTEDGPNSLPFGPVEKSWWKSS